MSVPDVEMEKVRSTLRQFVRDWSADVLYFSQILMFRAKESETRVTNQYATSYWGISATSTIGTVLMRSRDFSYVSCRSKIHILVPGAGLGRLAFDLAQSGFSVQGNEFSFFMLLASNFILNRYFCLAIMVIFSVERKEEFTLYPWLHAFSNQQRIDDQVRPVLIPDVIPGGLGDGVDFSMVAGEFLEVYADQQGRVVSECCS